MKEITMKNYVEKDYRVKDYGAKIHRERCISERFRGIVKRKNKIILVGIILGGILMFTVFASAAESDFNSNKGDIIRMEQRASWTDEENYKGVVEIEFSGLAKWNSENLLAGENYETQQEDDEGTEGAEDLTGINNTEIEIEDLTGINNTETETEDMTGVNDAETEIVEEMEEENYVDTDNANNADNNNTAGMAQGTNLQRLLCFSTYLSEYFMLDQTGGSLPIGVYTEEIPVINRLGTETMITKLYYTFTETDLKQDHVMFSIPVALRKEYRYAETKVLFPVFQDGPLAVNLNGEQAPGAYASTVEEVETDLFSGEESRQSLIQSTSPELLARAGKMDFSMELSQEKETSKAGETLYYHVTLNNTGEREIRNITLQAQAKDYPVYWQQNQELTTMDGNGQAVLSKLASGESQELIFWLQSGESEEGVMEINVQAYTQNETDSVKKEGLISTNIQPLTADFTVEKTADCILAGPGETITYQICIRNTGERILHSVLSTEKFLDSRIKARFVEMEGVQLNKSRTKALIPKILPGESVGLKAVVVLPENIESSELINQVTVTTNETGEKQIRSEAAVTVQGISPTPAKIQETLQTSNETAETVERDSPKTGDPMFKEEYEQLMLLAFGISIAAAAHMLYQKRKRP